MASRPSAARRVKARAMTAEERPQSAVTPALFGALALLGLNLLFLI